MASASDGAGTGGEDAVLARLLQQLTVETDRFASIFGERNGIHRTDLNALVVIMEALRRGEAISPSEVARALHLSASATTAVLDRLEHAGHVTRDRRTNDRRRIDLAVAETARSMGEQYFRPLTEEMARSWAHFTPDQRATVAEFLRVSIDATIRTRAALAEESGPDR